MYERKYRFILCFLALLEIASSSEISTNNLLQSEDVRIYSTPSPNYEMKQPGFVYYRQLRIKFTFHNEIIVLLLMLDEDRRTDTAVYSLGTAEIYRIDVPGSNAENTIVPQRYKGENGSFSIICEWGPRSLYRCQVSGVFFNHGVLWGVVPLQIEERSQKKKRKFSLETNVDSWHRIFKPPSKDAVNWIWPRNSFPKEMHTFQNRMNRRKRSVKESYIVDLALILHANVISKFMKVLPLTFTREQIVYFLKEYYIEISRGMDLMLNTMSSQKFTVGAKLTSLIYTYEGNASDIFHKENVNLPELTAWSHEPSNTITQMCDHIILLTVEDIHSWKENSMCTGNSTSISQEMFGMQTAMRAVHTVAVSLGIQPDSEGNNCPINDDYIMASYKFPSRDKMNKLNRFRFSSCSKKYLKAFLSQNGKGFCMLAESNFTESFEKDLVPPGQRLSANQQCRLRFGKDSDIYECEGENFENQDGLCADLNCLSEGRCTEMVPLEQTSCGNRKWCEQGYCRPNRLAPEIPMHCWLGDKSEDPLLPDSNLTCKDIAYRFMYMCYDKQIRSTCCWTCFFLRSVLDDCPYGDRTTDCWEKECMFYSQQRLTYDCCSTCRVVSGSYRGNLWQIGLFILAAMSLKIHLL